VSPHLVGVALAVGAAWFYGSADFFGGLASRRITAYQVMVISALIGLFTMTGLAIIWGEMWPAPHMVIWGGAGGLVGTLGLIALYQGLVTGRAAVVSPVSGVIGAAIPVVFGALTAGLPGTFQLAGFAVAIPGIWLVTTTSADAPAGSHGGFLLGVLAGGAFGLFFICIAHIGPGAVFGPLAITKAAAVLLALVLVAATRVRLPSFKDNPTAILAGALDPAANALFLMSSHYTRLDVAAVLASLYPLGTVVLSRLVLKEHIVGLQWVGVVLCMAAIALITL
jgi:drug/metabolite transporter (DMT)-like permease